MPGHVLLNIKTCADGWVTANVQVLRQALIHNLVTAPHVTDYAKERMKGMKENATNPYQIRFAKCKLTFQRPPPYFCLPRIWEELSKISQQFDAAW